MPPNHMVGAPLRSLGIRQRSHHPRGAIKVRSAWGVKCFKKAAWSKISEAKDAAGLGLGPHCPVIVHR
jgi:hypothetical protein